MKFDILPIVGDDRPVAKRTKRRRGDANGVGDEGGKGERKKTRRFLEQKPLERLRYRSPPRCSALLSLSLSLHPSTRSPFDSIESIPQSR